MAPTVLSTDTTDKLPLAFNRLAWSNLAAQVAEQIGLAAAPIIAVLVLGAGAGETGLLQAAERLPFVLLAIPAGILADRTSHRRLMAGAEALRMAALLAILILARLDMLTLPLLAVLGFAGATGTVAYSVSAPSLIPALVRRTQLAAANGRIELARSVAFIAGPALGGVLVGWIGVSPTYAIATTLSGIAVILLLRLQEPARQVVSRRSPLTDLTEGGRFVLTHQLLRPILFTAVFFNIAFFVLQAIYVPYAHQRLGLSAGEIGITLGLYGVGMVAGAMLAGTIMRRFAFGRLILIGPFMGLAASLVMALTIVVPNPILAGSSFFLIGMGPIIWTISSTTLRQIVTTNAMLGRVAAMTTTATAGAGTIGAGIGALIGSSISLRACLIVAAIGFVVQAIAITTSAAARLTVLPDPAPQPITAS